MEFLFPAKTWQFSLHISTFWSSQLWPVFYIKHISQHSRTSLVCISTSSQTPPTKYFWRLPNHGQIQSQPPHPCINLVHQSCFFAAGIHFQLKAGGFMLAPSFGGCSPWLPASMVEMTWQNNLVEQSCSTHGNQEAKRKSKIQVLEYILPNHTSSITLLTRFHLQM